LGLLGPLVPLDLRAQKEQLVLKALLDLLAPLDLLEIKD
jgi:hypothetical protein